MSFEAAAWAIKQSPTLAVEKLILIALADAHNRSTKRCDPSLATLADVAMCSERTAMRAIKSLTDQGFISTTKELGKRTKYVLKFDINPCQIVTPDKLSPVTPVTPTPDTRVTPPLTPVSPEPGSTSKKSGNNGKSKKFTPPTVEQVREYCEERKNGINPNAFVDHYQAANWYRGKNKIQDWKACVRTWEQRNKPKQQDQRRLREL